MDRVPTGIFDKGSVFPTSGAASGPLMRGLSHFKAVGRDDIRL